MDNITDYSFTSNEVQTWFGLESIAFMLQVLGAYLLIVLVIGPAYMKNKSPYQLKTFMIIYNTLQVVACVYMINEVFNITSHRILQFWTCSLFPGKSRLEYKYNRLSYFAFWLKITELLETVVFVLRKKQQQVSTLHLYHHCTTISLVYFGLKYHKGGHGLYPLFLNSIVHVIMYTYYLAAAVCDKKIVHQLLPIKKSITTIQMVQFVLILIQAVSVFTHCEVAPQIFFYFVFVIAGMFYGFFNFYKKSYTERQNQKKQQQQRVQ